MRLTALLHLVKRSGQGVTKLVAYSQALSTLPTTYKNIILLFLYNYL